jgi:hypothetical protein
LTGPLAATPRWSASLVFFLSVAPGAIYRFGAEARAKTWANNTPGALRDPMVAREFLTPGP